MEGVMIEQDAIEMLLGEISDVTLGNSHAAESGTMSLSSEPKPPVVLVDTVSSTSTNFTDIHNPPQASKHGSSMDLYDSLSCPRSPFNGEIQSSRNLASLCSEQITPTNNNDHEISNLPDEQSLALALEELSIDPTSLNHGMLLGEQSSAHLSKSLSQLNFYNMSNPTLPNVLNGFDSSNPALRTYPPYMISSEANTLCGKFDGRDVERFSKLHETNKQNIRDSLLNDFVEQQQNIPWHSWLINPAMHGFQLLPQLCFDGLELPASVFQQKYYLDGQSPAYLHPQNLGQANMAWRNIDTQRYCRINVQFSHLNQLQNQGPHVHHVQKCNNSATWPLHPDVVQPSFGMPIRHQIKHPNEDSYLNGNIPIGYNQLNLSLLARAGCKHYSQGMCTKGEICRIPHGQNPTSANVLTQSAKEFVGHQGLERVSKHNFPQKILTKSHGINSVRPLKSASTTTNVSTHHANSNGRLYSNGYGVQSLVVHDGSLHLDDQISESSSPDNSDCRHVSRMAQVKCNSLDEFVGRIYIIAKDQHGCRFLQQKLIEGASEDVEKIFVEIISHIVELTTDQFGNYLVQKLLDVCNEDQRLNILNAITRKVGKFVDISCDMHGTHAVQKVIETLKTPEQISMVVSSLKPGVVRLIKDINGNHVAQCCLQYLTPDHCQFLFDAAIAHFIELATDRQGCCVLQKCLNHLDGNQKEWLMSEITSNALFLAQDRFGNYVVQFVIDLKVPWVTVQVLDQLRGKFGNLSIQKFSSNVVEKCLKVATDDEQMKIIHELINGPQLLQILRDPYGNYVMQSALKECKEGALHAVLVEAIRPHVPVLRSSTYGKKVLSCSSFKK